MRGERPQKVSEDTLVSKKGVTPVVPPRLETQEIGKIKRKILVYF